MKLPKYRPVLLLLATALFAPLMANAQVLYGSLTGTVTDPSGGAVPGAKIQILNVDTGVSKPAFTNDHGMYVVDDLQPGSYKVTVDATGFAQAVTTGVSIVQNTVRRLDVQIKLASAGQNITISAEAEALQTDRPDVNAHISTTETANLPMSTGRSYQAVFKTLPGFSYSSGGATPSSSGNPAGSVSYNVNGATAYGNNTKVDGASDIYPWQPQNVMMVPPAESIEAVSVVTNSFDAEQGAAAGAAINVTLKSGTNQFHGAAWEYSTNSDLKARNFFYYGANNPKNILNQFGLNLGGPIKKNKLFFFADWERYVQRTLYSGFQTIPTDALKQGNFNGTGATIYDPTTGNTATGAGRTPFPNNMVPASVMSTAAQKMAALLPEPNQNNGISNNYFYGGDFAFTRDNVDGKINYNPTDKTAFFVRYGAAPHNVIDPQTLGAAGGSAVDGGQFTNGSGLTQHVSIGGTYTINPNLVLDGNSGFSRLRLSVVNAGAGNNFGLNVLGIPGTNGPSPLQGGIPQFSFTGFSTMGDANSSTPLVFRDNLWVESANLSWSKGSHNFRFGAEIVHILMADYQANSTVGVRGGFTFSGGMTALNGGTAPNQYNSWADFLLGLPSAMNKDIQFIDPAVVAENEFSFYARDRWQVSRKLTVDYGLRWEIYPYSKGEHGIGGIDYNPSTNLVSLGGINGVPSGVVDTGHGMPAPRAGLAYRLDNKTVVRAGFGININPETFRNNIQTYPDVISLQYSGATTFVPAGNLVTGIPAFVGPSLSAGRIPLPANVGAWIYPSPFRRGYAESYNFTIQREIPAGFNIQAGYVANRDIRPESGVDLNAGAPGTGKNGQPYYLLWGNSSRISSLSPIDNNRYNSLQMRLTRKMARGTMGVSYTFSKTLDATDSETGGSLTWNWAPVQYRNYALAGFDRTHNFEAYYVYSLPFGKGEKWVNKGIAAALAGGWQLNGILSRASGTPFTISSSSTSLNAPSNSQTADQVVSQVQILGGHGPGNPYFDPNAFLPVTAVRFGTSGRDIIRGPGLFNTDLSLFRTFAIREKFKLQFRAEAFGLTNTPSFGNPATTASNATFVNGAATNLNGYDIITSSTGDRQIRFALKLSF